jgi:short-subunit dehydrogenase
MRLNEKVIWITGASSGIGEGLVYALAKMNCKLILSARNVGELERVRQNCDATSEILPFDLAHFDNVKEYVAKAIAVFGKIDVLILNGGVSQRSLIIETDLAKAILPHFIENQNGHFAVVTSLMGKFGSPYRSGYCGAKHALHGFFDVLRMEHQTDGVNVTMVCPGFVQTNVAKNALIGNGSKQHVDDEATRNGLPVKVFAQRMIKAVENNKFEVYIGRKEVLGVYLKRYLPKMLHYFVLRSKVR